MKYYLRNMINEGKIDLQDRMVLGDKRVRVHIDGHNVVIEDLKSGTQSKINNHEVPEGGKEPLEIRDTIWIDGDLYELQSHKIVRVEPKQTVWLSRMEKPVLIILALFFVTLVISHYGTPLRNAWKDGNLSLWKQNCVKTVDKRNYVSCWKLAHGIEVPKRLDLTAEDRARIMTNVREWEDKHIISWQEMFDRLPQELRKQVRTDYDKAEESFRKGKWDEASKRGHKVLAVLPDFENVKQIILKSEYAIAAAELRAKEPVDPTPAKPKSARRSKNLNMGGGSGGWPGSD